MKRPWVLFAAGLGLLGLLMSLLMANEVDAPSALSRGPRGLFAARRYLEARGAEVNLRDRAAAELPAGGVLLTAFPWVMPALEKDQRRFAGWVQAGGTLVVAYSGGERGPAEDTLLAVAGVGTTVARSEAPLGPLAWRRWANEEWSLQAAPSLGPAAHPLGLRAPTWLPVPPAGARVLYRHEEGPVVFTLPQGRGEWVFLPVELLSNARIGKPGHADLLETLLADRGTSWGFDELHQGLGATAAAGAARPRLAVDLFLLHLAVLYALAVVALGRRFGSPWREAPARTGSAGAFLLGLGRLHDRLGHHPQAGRLLLARAAELDPRFAPGPELRRSAAPASGAALVDLARAVAAARGQTRRRTTPSEKETR